MKSKPKDLTVENERPARVLTAYGHGSNADPLLSRDEAAAYLGISPRTLAIWASTGRYGLEVIKIGRLAKYRRSSIDQFINSRAK